MNLFMKVKSKLHENLDNIDLGYIEFKNFRVKIIIEMEREYFDKKFKEMAEYLEEHLDMKFLGFKNMYYNDRDYIFLNLKNLNDQMAVVIAKLDGITDKVERHDSVLEYHKEELGKIKLRLNLK
jgi:hypothetical protein